MKMTFDPEKLEAIFTLVSSVKENLRDGTLNAAMANLVKALQFYLTIPMLKKEKAQLEPEFYDLQSQIAGHPKFIQKYGPVSFRRGEHQKNIDYMNQLIQFGVEDFQERIQLGIELLTAQRLEEAHEVFYSVLDDPDSELSHFIQVGDAFLKNKLWKNAQDVFAKAIERDPESLHLLNRMAISLRKDGEYEQALSIYRKAMLLSPRDEGLYYNLARLFLDWGKPKSAGQALQNALTINPKFDAASRLLTAVQETLSKMSGPAERPTGEQT